MSALDPATPSTPQTVGLASSVTAYWKKADTINVVQRVAETQTFFQRVMFWPYQGWSDKVLGGVNYADTPTDNVGFVEIGWDQGEDDDGNVVVQLSRKLLPGESYAIEAPAGQKYDLAKLYFKTGVAEDGLLIEYS